MTPDALERRGGVVKTLAEWKADEAPKAEEPKEEPKAEKPKKKRAAKKK